MTEPLEDKEKETAQKPDVVSIEDKEFSEAVERVRRKYGSDLSAFIRDVQRDVEKVHRSSQSGHRAMRIGN